MAIRSRALTLAASLPSRKAPTQSTALPEHHPATLLMAKFDATASRLITLVVQLHRAEAELLQVLAGHLGQWERQILGRRGLPKPPESELQLPRS